ncbi:3'-5' exonuclease [Arcanobacterium pinnipediorum]|uniref:3'-5' exonuclease n=1 Tax=Arcanobacterium pinnipediorum TaxID=1503041 RepID=A0ABY5AJT2_9ACTO|nr:3'-5' exonuclease [Arcanobacterium pinnipediorum]USR80115.1 3'-5' exonuclease [Arcanobacterium pinnipediorum]
MDYAVVDLETTGLDPHRDRIVEVGVVLLNQKLEQEAFFTSIVNPQVAVSATHIHHIDDQGVANAPTFSQLLPSLIKLFNHRILIAHNVVFDMAFLNCESERSALPLNFERHHAVCTMDQSRIYCSDGSHSLAGLAQRLNIETPIIHRALPDALTCAELFRYYVQAEARGLRVTHSARNRRGERVQPCEWARARPWHDRTRS